MTADVAVVGLGRMGSAIAERLLASGRRVTVWNRTAGKAADLVAAGAEEAADLAEVAGVPVIVSMVLDDEALASLAGDDRLFSRAGTRVWIDCSTVSVSAAEEAGRAAAVAGVAFVSAPVSGNPGVVRAGNAVFALSGDDEDALDDARVVLEAVGQAVHLVGAGASAALVKQCTNALLGIVMEALAEVAVLGEKGGVSRRALMDFINASAVGSPFSRYKTESIVSLDMTPTFTGEGLRKDLRLAIGSARSYEASTPLINAAEVEYTRLVSSGVGADRDFAALILQVAGDSGLDIRPEGDPVD